MTNLEVVNACLASMGEKPINSINDPHPMRYAATQLLYRENRRRQAVGRWYNKETIELQPDALDHKVYLPGDTIGFQTLGRQVAIRGRKLYDLKNGTDVWTENVKGTLVRLVKFDELPESAAAYIASEVVLKFQLDYDGDSTKTRQLVTDRDDAKELENVDNIRNARNNLLLSNPRLVRFNSMVRRARRDIRPY